MTVLVTGAGGQDGSPHPGDGLARSELDYVSLLLDEKLHDTWRWFKNHGFTG